MTEKDIFQPQLWTPRPPEESMAIYAEWAATYDADIQARGYHTPGRIAAALADHVDADASILDYGCGTGLSGRALHDAGFTLMDGTDITTQMLDIATGSGLYRRTWLSPPGALDAGVGAYAAIVAAGVVSRGAAPAETLRLLTDKLAPGQIVAVSFNDPTLDDAEYLTALDAEVAGSRAEILFREHGPHLDDVGMGSDVILLRRL